jgi:DnaK suppressor protein
MSPDSADPDSGTPTKPKRSWPRGGLGAADKRRLREKLVAMRQSLRESSKDLADEALKGSGQEFKVDHMADFGSDNYEQDVSLSLLEGETELLQAIEYALARIDGKEELPYGICEDCALVEAWDPETSAPWIRIGRLEVVPYALYCVPHQEAREEG